MTKPEALEDSILITGPTASGKSSLGFELARRLSGEIVSLDSMKVYRDMDIVTAKASSERRARVRHHLLDLVDPSAEFSTGDWLTALAPVLADVRARGRLPVLCGGTALYLMAVLRGFSDLPSADQELRDRLRAEADRDGVEQLYRRLEEVDPAAAARYHSTDLRRIVRALEVIELSGRPMSETWAWEDSPRGIPRMYGLEWERSELYSRTDRRVDLMVERGLFEEVAALRRRDPPLGGSARQCIGYKEVLEGEAEGASRDEVIERIKRNTRRFVKRQLTWFRKLPVRWIDVSEPYRPEEIAARLVTELAEGGHDTKNPVEETG